MVGRSRSQTVALAHDGVVGVTRQVVDNRCPSPATGYAVAAVDEVDELGAVRQDRHQEQDGNGEREQGPVVQAPGVGTVAEEGTARGGGDYRAEIGTAPAAHTAWRQAQQDAYLAGVAAPPYPTISDDEIRESVEGSQLRLMAERGIDLTIFSPRASAMGHHVGDEAVSTAWTRVCNDLIARVVELYPDRFVGVCQLPQSPGVPIANSISELRRCVEELGFVGCNLNPDPSGGHWTSPPLTDRSWYDFYEALVELDVPAMVHVSAVTNPNFHAWTAPRFPDGWIVLFHAAACWFKYSVRTSCGVR
jgi:hypothetical protein